MVNKLPIGVAPYYIAILKRNEELSKAILRYSESADNIEHIVKQSFIWAKEIEQNCRSFSFLDESVKMFRSVENDTYNKQVKGGINMKIDCGYTENYLKEKARMTNYDASSESCGIYCRECPLNIQDNNSSGCIKMECEYPDEAVSIVQQWSDEHPRKTYKDDFLEKFPNASKGEIGYPAAIPCVIYKSNNFYCKHNCKECWDKVMEK